MPNTFFGNKKQFYKNNYLNEGLYTYMCVCVCVCVTDQEATLTREFISVKPFQPDLIVIAKNMGLTKEELHSVLQHNYY